MQLTDAFWEFIKLLSLKMDNDKNINRRYIFFYQLRRYKVSVYSLSKILQKIFHNFREELELSIIKEGCLIKQRH